MTASSMPPPSPEPMAPTAPPPGGPPTGPYPSPPMPPGPPYPCGYAGQPPMPPARRPTMWIAVGAVVVVVIIVLAVLLLLGAAHTSNKSGPITYSEASSAVSPVAQGYHGGGWKTLLAEGLDTSASLSLPFNASSLTGLGGSSGCTVSAIASSGQTFTLPAYTGSLSAGTSAGWLFGFINATGYLLIATDLNGTVSLIATIGGSSCPLGAEAAFVSGIPSGVIDSSAAANAAWGVGGSAFVAAHPGATAMFGITTGISVFGLTRPPMWSVVFEACTPSVTASGQVVATFNATINAVTGQVLGHANSTGTCGSLGSLGGGLGGGGGGGTTLNSVLNFGTPVATTKGSNYWYNFTVSRGSSGVTWGDLTLSVVGSSGTPVTSGISNYTVVGITGTVLLSSSGPIETSWTNGASTPTLGVGTTQVLSVETSTTLSGLGYSLEASGDSSFPGTVLFSIP